MTNRIDDLVDGLEPAPARSAPAVFGGPLALASIVALAGVMVLLGPRPDMGSAISGLPFWIKLTVPGLVAGGAGLALARLSRPGLSAGTGLIAVAAVMVSLLAAALVNLVMMPAELRLPALMGYSVTKCLIAVSAFAIPFLLAGFWALRRMAPVQPRLAGFALGLVAGGLSAAVYALSCGEDSLAFIASWYQLAMLGVACFTALIAPRIVRW